MPDNVIFLGQSVQRNDALCSLSSLVSVCRACFCVVHAQPYSQRQHVPLHEPVAMASSSTENTGIAFLSNTGILNPFSQMTATEPRTFLTVDHSRAHTGCQGPADRNPADLSDSWERNTGHLRGREGGRSWMALEWACLVLG